jgi:hypothetical protein
MRTKYFIIGLIAIATVALAVVIPNFIRDRSTSAQNALINNLRQIDAENAKSGFLKDTNGHLIYVGVSNTPATNPGSAK